MGRSIWDAGNAVGNAIGWLAAAEEDLRDFDREAEGRWASVHSALALIGPAMTALAAVRDCIAADVAEQERYEAADDRWEAIIQTTLTDGWAGCGREEV